MFTCGVRGSGVQGFGFSRATRAHDIVDLLNTKFNILRKNIFRS